MSKYKEGQIIFGKDNRIFIVRRYLGASCLKCSFSILHNPHYDMLRSCENRRYHYLSEIARCQTKLIPEGCYFKDITEGV